MGKKTGIELAYGDGSSSLKQGSLTDYVLSAGDTLFVYLNGIAQRIEVSAAESSLRASGGTSTDIQVLSKGLMNLSGNAVGSNLTVSGTLNALAGSSVFDAVISESGSFTGRNASITRLTLEGKSEFLIYSASTVTTCTLNSGCSGTFDSGSTVNGLVVHSGATLTLGSNVTLQGTISIGSRFTHNNVSNAASATADFLMAEIVANSAALINWSLCAFGAVRLSVESTPKYGTFALANNAADFSVPVSIQLQEYSALEATVGNAATYHNSVYTLDLTGGTLSVEVAAFATTTSVKQLTWGDINQTDNFTLELSNAGKVSEIEIQTQGVDMLGLDSGTYNWQVRSSSESDNWQLGEQFTQSETPEQPQELVADESNGLTDLFFAQYDGVWEGCYTAMHVGNKGGWTGTHQFALLENKAKITSVFAGSDDASILLLDDSENGAALFVDDIYSAAPGSADRARIANINTIIATRGADVIDLTSQKFDFPGGVTVKGGEGSDYIWANSGNNTLFGESGDDNIVGGSDADEIIGGTGNDTLHGGGGADVFCFGENWGQDTVQQLATGSVVLWFKEDSGSWNPSTLTYTQGDNKVSVFGVSSVELRFGKAAGHEEQYEKLLAIGAFA